MKWWVYGIYQLRFTEVGAAHHGMEESRLPVRECPEPAEIIAQNFRLADDIAFRFSNKSWADWPLTAEKYAG